MAASSYDAGFGTDRPVYLHEGVHALLAHDVRVNIAHGAHWWLHEGLASYVQGCVYPGSFHGAYDELLGQPLMHHSAVLAVAWSRDGRRVVTGDADQNVQIWDVATRQRLLHLPGHRGGINDVSFSRDGRLIVTASRDHTVRLWDAATGKPVGPPFAHEAPVVRAGFSSDGDTIQTAPP